MDFPSDEDAGAADEFTVLNEDDGSKTYTLAFAVGDVTELRLRRPLGGDYEATDAATGPTERKELMLARLSDLDRKEIAVLDMLDFNTATEIVTWFEQNAAPDARESIDIVFHDDGTATVPLSLPLKSEGQDLIEVTLRRMRPADVKAAEQIRGVNKRAVEMVSRLGNIPRATVRKLDCFDFVRLNNTGADFLQKRPATGEKSS